MSTQSDPEPINFVATHWSLVRQAGQGPVETRQVSLGILLQRYLPALRAHLMIDRRLATEAAEDILQGFIADKVVEQNLVALADPTKGKFRSFLLVSLDRYVIDQHRREASAKRGGSAVANIEASGSEELIAPDAQPSQQFDLVWARELVAQALRLMMTECTETGRQDVWQVFESRIISPAFEGVEPMPYDELIQRFSLESPLQAYNLLTTAKRMFERHLHQAAAEYAGGDAPADEEINDLKNILAKFRA